MSDCIFCNIAAGNAQADICYQDDSMVCFSDIMPKEKIHKLLIPRVHLESLEDFKEEHDQLLAEMMRKVPEIAHSFGLQSGYRTIIHTGPDGGQIIPHFHIHLRGGGKID